MITQYLQLYVTGSGMPGKVEVIQADSGRKLKCQIMDMTIPEGCTARVYGKKPSGAEIYNDCTIKGNAVIVELTTQFLAEIGTVPAQVELTKEGDTVTSFEFLLVVKRSLVKGSAIESSNEFTALENALNDAKAAAYQAVSEYVKENGIETGATEEQIKEALGYTPADEERVSQLSNEIAEIVDACKFGFETPCGIKSVSERLSDVNYSGNVGSYTGNDIPTFYVSNKNLLPQISAQTKNGIAVTKNENGTITLNGTATDTVSFFLSHNVVLPLTNGTFTISLNNSDIVDDSQCFAEVQGNGTSKTLVKCPLNKVNNSMTFTLSETDYMDYFRIRIPSGVTLNNFVLGLQIEEGSENTGFVKHEEYRTALSEIGTTHECFEGCNYLCATYSFKVCGSYLTVIKNEIEKVKEELEKSIEVLAKETTKNFHGKTVVCFGDSITGNYVITDYPSIIAEITGATVYNVGFGGCTMVYKETEERKDFSMVSLVNSIVNEDFSAQENSGVSITLANDDRRNYVPERIATLKNIDWNNVDYITIAYGTNDWNGNYSIDNEENPLDTTSYIGAFRYSIENLLTAYPHIKILVLTPLWRWWDETAGGVPYRDSDNYAKGTGWYLYDYGNALIEACKEYHIPCLDLYYECMMNKFNRYVYFNTNDGTHPNEVGRTLLAEKISAKLGSTY